MRGEGCGVVKRWHARGGGSQPAWPIRRAPPAVPPARKSRVLTTTLLHEKAKGGDHGRGQRGQGGGRERRSAAACMPPAAACASQPLRPAGSAAPSWVVHATPLQVSHARLFDQAGRQAGGRSRFAAAVLQVLGVLGALVGRGGGNRVLACPGGGGGGAARRGRGGGVSAVGLGCKAEHKEARGTLSAAHPLPLPQCAHRPRPRQTAPVRR